jgi:hypothetical protein
VTTTSRTDSLRVVCGVVSRGRGGGEKTRREDAVRGSALATLREVNLSQWQRKPNVLQVCEASREVQAVRKGRDLFGGVISRFGGNQSSGGREGERSEQREIERGDLNSSRSSSFPEPSNSCTRSES